MTITPEQLVAYADGALGAAGHEVTDPAMRDLLLRVARREISADDAVALARDYYDSSARSSARTPEGRL